MESIPPPLQTMGPLARDFNMRGWRRGMQVFEDVEFARLRSYECGSYLHAGEDGRSVYHGSLGAASHNAVWAVEELVVPGAPPTRYLLLRGAYGRYLGAPDARDDHSLGAMQRDLGVSDVVDDPDSEGCCACCPLSFCSLVGATQRDRDGEEVDAIMWRATGCGACDVIEAREARGVVLLHDRSGRYLRGNKSFLACRRSVSVDGDVNKGETLRWEVVRVPRSQGRPELPFATEADLGVTACFPSPLREIWYARADDDGNIVGRWESLRYKGRSVRILRDKLARVGQQQLGENFTLCVRAGEHGQLTPLLINLPRSQEALHIVLLRRNSTADNELIFPNVNALSSAGSEERGSMTE